MRERIIRVKGEGGRQRLMKGRGEVEEKKEP
jgi:hypothetical protein